MTQQISWPEESLSLRAPLYAPIVEPEVLINLVAEFCKRSSAEKTQRTYHRVTREFLEFIGTKSVCEVTPDDVKKWRDMMTFTGSSSSTVSFKLSVVRSLFDYLHSRNAAFANPALSRFVLPPESHEQSKRRSLTLKEVGYVLAGPDRNNPEGARDYALLNLMLRT